MKSMIYELLSSALAFISMLMIIALLMILAGAQFPDPRLPTTPQTVEKPSVMVNGIKFEIE